MKTQQHFKEQYRELKTLFLINTPKLVRSASAMVEQMSSDEARTQLTQRLNENNTIVRQKGLRNFQWCEKTRRARAQVRLEAPLKLEHSALFALNQNGVLSLIIVDQRPDKYTDNLIIATGSKKSYKAGIRIDDPFADNALHSYETILVEVCNKSQDGKRVLPDKFVLMEGARDVKSTGLLRVNRVTNTPIFYKIYPITHLKFDLITIIQGVMRLDVENKITKGSSKLHYLLFNMASALKTFHDGENRAHGDVKCENFLMDVEANVHLIDEVPIRMIVEKGMLHGTEYLTAPETRAIDRSSADTFSMSLCLLQMVFHFFLNSKKSSRVDQALFESLQNLYKAHMDSMTTQIDSPINLDLLLANARIRQLEFINTLGPHFNKLNKAVGRTDTDMVELLRMLQTMLAIDPRRRMTLERVIALCSSLNVQAHDVVIEEQDTLSASVLVKGRGGKSATLFDHTKTRPSKRCKKSLCVNNSKSTLPVIESPTSN